MLEPGGQLGFEEGNAVQYTWAVPQDLSALADLIGGDNRATAELTTFFTKLNAGRDQPFDWAGNEPSLWSPWEFDAFGAPWKTQSVVREIADDLYADAPVDEPGNDDLGAIASWYVWAAIGLYPLTPGTANLAVASPLFPVVSVDLSGGHHLVEHAPNASRSTPFVHSLRVVGNARRRLGRDLLTGSPGGDVERRLEPTVAAVLGAGQRCHPDLRPRLDAGSVVGVGSGERLPIRRRGTDPGARLHASERRDEAGGRSARDGGSRCPARATGERDRRLAGIGRRSRRHAGQRKLRRRYPDRIDEFDWRIGAELCIDAPSTQALTVTAQSPGSRVLEVQLQTTKDVALPPVDVDLDVTG